MTAPIICGRLQPRRELLDLFRGQHFCTAPIGHEALFLGTCGRTPKNKLTPAELQQTQRTASQQNAEEKRAVTAEIARRKKAKIEFAADYAARLEAGDRLAAAKRAAAGK